MTTETPAIWSDADPLMQAIAAAVYEQCETYSVSSVVVDDPRNIAAVAATVARRVLGTTEQADTVAAPAADRCICGETACESELCDCDDAPCPVDHASAEAQQPTPAPAEGQRQPAPVPCTNPCIAYMTDESHDPAPAEEAVVVAHRLYGHGDLRCLRCVPAPRGDIWTPVTSEDLPDGGVCGQCATDVLIPAPAKETKTEAPVSPTAALLTTRCNGCPHPLDSHLRYGACLADGCTCHRYQPTP